MQVVVDRYIPFVQDALRGMGAEVVALEPDRITRESLRDADALLVRTRTRVDEALLEGTRVRFAATATIGTDHIDGAYLAQRGIAWASAPGCNAQAVCDYVEEGIDEYMAMRPTAVPTIGIIGCGHVGSKVKAMAERKGMRTIVSDPPKGYMTDIKEIAEQADILTFHTPLTREGEHRTWHLCDGDLLARCKPNALIINAARGGVADEKALLEAHRQKGIAYILDTWEGEPQVDRAVLDGAFGASFHIAGYSLEGKINASQQVLDAFCGFFGLKPCIIDKKAVSLQTHSGDTEHGWLQRITTVLKARPEQFETLRKHYALR